MPEDFDAAEARRLIVGAAAVAEELIGDDETEFTIALLRAAHEAERRAAERSRALEEFRASMSKLVGYAISAIDAGDMELVRAAVDAIGREVKKEFARREGA